MSSLSGWALLLVKKVFLKAKYPLSLCFLQIMSDEEVESHDSLTDKIISFPGPVFTVSNLRACASSKLRAVWTPAVVKDAMANLVRSGTGEAVT